MTPPTVLVQRLRAADARDIARGLELIADWDADMERRQLTPEEYAAEIALALPRIAGGHGGVTGIGVDLAESMLIVHFARDWTDDPLFPCIASAIASVAQLMRADASAHGGAP